MKHPVIEIENLSKVYTIGHQHQVQYETLRDNIGRIARKPLELLTGQRLDKEQLWALKNVSFSVEQGDVVGIIGRNGSGKSTLLKVLSRITQPTEGRATMRGRVASLLEVGTGFHPELTGRENIFLNGAILGMSKREISKKFDEIVAFSEVEKFLDTPVKFYSSGMYVRLAFAVAAHLDPDILIVDEVLAVGDAAFQKKSLGKMSSVAKEGRTILFVSHNLSAIQNICNRAIILNKGELAFDGETKKAVARYLSYTTSETGYALLDQPRQTSKLRFQSVGLSDTTAHRRAEFQAGDPIRVELDYEVTQEGKEYQLVIEVWNEDGSCIFATSNFDQNPAGMNKKIVPGRYRAVCDLPTHELRDGRYYLSFSSSIPGVEMLDEVPYPISFILEGGDSEILQLGGHGRLGVLYRSVLWKVQRSEK
jgi:lipopolysaccharide transport system ATP-binding protein